MSKTDPLLPSKEKIKRAKSKLENLRAGIATYIKSYPHVLSLKVDGNINYAIATRVKEVPEDLVWELVEGVGHLRGALDKLACALVELNGRGDSGVFFPFGGMGSDGKPNPFPDARMEKGVKKKLTPDQWDLIARQQPYPGGNETLWAVNVIANIDKHSNTLIKISASLENRAEVLSMYGVDDYASGRIAGLVLTDEEREQVLFAFSGENPHVNVECNVTQSIIFGPIVPVEGKNILKTLNEQIRLVEGIVEIFEGAFFS